MNKTALSMRERGFTQGLTSKSKGFTLIELLVVIAIIGLLSAVVLASLNSARQKGADAAVQSDLKNAQSQAEIIYDNTTPNGYGSVCTDPTVKTQVTGAANATGATVPSWAATQASAAGQAVCHSSDDAYAILVPLKTDTSKGWCVDSNGSSRKVAVTGLTGSGANQYACPQS